jgi:hypothetical protein
VLLFTLTSEGGGGGGGSGKTRCFETEEEAEAFAVGAGDLMSGFISGFMLGVLGRRSTGPRRRAAGRGDGDCCRARPREGQAGSGQAATGVAGSPRQDVGA